MDDGASPGMGILIFAILTGIDFVMVGFSAAMQNLSEAQVRREAREGSGRTELLVRYLDCEERYVQICRLLMLLAHMLAGFFLVPAVRRMILPESAGILVTVAVDVVVFALLMLLILVCGIYTPEKVAARKPEKWAFWLVMPFRAVEIVLLPMLWLADTLSDVLSRLFGVDPHSDTGDVTEEEIIYMVKEGHEQGVLLASEAEMIHNIFEFGDKEARDIMTHRKNIAALDGSLTFAEAMEFFRESSHSRFPVYEGDIDNITGLLHIREALALSTEQSVYGKSISAIDGLVMEVDFIPETRNLNSLFAQMQAKKNHMVIVVDEYGQTAGIVAMEDILEEIVGNIEDEHDEEEDLIEVESEGIYRMSGMTPFADVQDLLFIDREEEEPDDGFETLNGFLISQLGRIPADGEEFSLTARGCLFDILLVENKMIQSVRVSRLPEEEQTDFQGESAEATCGNQETVIE